MTRTSTGGIAVKHTFAVGLIGLALSLGTLPAAGCSQEESAASRVRTGAPGWASTMKLAQAEEALQGACLDWLHRCHPEDAPWVEATAGLWNYPSAVSPHKIAGPWPWPWPIWTGLPSRTV